MFFPHNQLTLSNDALNLPFQDTRALHQGATSKMKALVKGGQQRTTLSWRKSKRGAQAKDIPESSLNSRSAYTGMKKTSNVSCSL